MELVKHAEMEFLAAGWMNEYGEYDDEMQEMICDNILELLRVFSDQGHSGSTAPYAVNIFKKLAMFEPLVPLTGEDWEWNKIGENYYQNKRCSHVFKEGDGAYDIEGRIFWEWFTDENGESYKAYYTSNGSRVPVTFPYTPTREYVEKSSDKD